MPRKCTHPKSKIEPGVFEEKSGSFMTLGPRKVEERHVIDWCSHCGAIRMRPHTKDPWSEWFVPVMSGGKGLKKGD